MDAEDASTFKILVATDIHLGVYEKSPLRRDDSFVTFEEVLQKAVEHKVDFILLGGDVFNDNKPSHYTLHRTTTLLRKYCMGSRPVDFSVVSDPQDALSNSDFGVANFQDPNYNVGVPVFAIHGNHDDPVGEHSLSALDLLSASGLVNYFGKSTSNENVQVSPLLLTKGSTKLALYGLGHIRDERLHRSFLHKKVKFFRPQENADEWFNLCVLHQNRNCKGQHSKNGIQEEMLRGFFDLVIWGHEHEQLLSAVPARGCEYDIIQPGSTIMTDGAMEDVNPKKVALIEVFETSYRVTPLTLRSVRPVEHLALALADETGLEKNLQDVTDYLAERVEEMITASKTKVASLPDAVLQAHPNLKIPIVRLRVDYHPDFPVVNPTLFGSKFMNRVANPQQILVNQKRRSTALNTSFRPSTIKPEMLSRPDANVSMADRISRMVFQILQDATGHQMTMMNERQLNDAVLSFVEKSEGNAVNSFVQSHLLQVQRAIWKDVRHKTDVSDEKLRLLAAKLRESVPKALEPTKEGEGRAVGVPKPEPTDGEDMPPPPPPLFAHSPDEDAICSTDQGAPPQKAPPKKGRGASAKSEPRKRAASTSTAPKKKKMADDSPPSQRSRELQSIISKWGKKK